MQGALSSDWECFILTLNVLHLHIEESRREAEVLVSVLKCFGSWSLEISRGQRCWGWQLADHSLMSCLYRDVPVIVWICWAFPEIPPAVVVWVAVSVAVSCCCPCSAVICTLSTGRILPDTFYKTGRKKWLPTQVRKGHQTLTKWLTICWALPRAVRGRGWGELMLNLDTK